MEQNCGMFVVSLDFELKWGAVFQNKSVKYGFDKRVPSVDKNIQEIMKQFDKHGVHATWAIVGAISCSSKNEAMQIISRRCPNDYNSKIGYIINDIKDEIYYFRPDLIKCILNANGQEIAIHTFSHFYVFDNSCTGETLTDEIRDSIESIKKVANTNINTLVFPKNQVDYRYINNLLACDISTIRGNAISKRFNTKGIINKYLRFIDAYFPICGSSSFRLNEVFHDGIFDVRESRFWRTYDKKLFAFEWMKLLRIKREMKYAALHGEVYHLWFHPHNLSTNLRFNLNTLDSILKYYERLRDKYGMVSCNMNECAKASQVINTRYA